MKLKAEYKITASLLLLFLSFFSISTAQEISQDLEPFNELKTFNGVEVLLVPSEENRIKISGESREEVKFEIVENRLEIKLSLKYIWSKDNTRIIVYSNTVDILDANEGSSIETHEILERENLVFRSQEGASIIVRADAKMVESKAISGGYINLEGKAEEQEVQINSGGLFHGKNFKTKKTVISSTTAAKGEVFASEYCKATAKIGGTVQIFGNPNEIDKTTSLGGKIL